MNEKPIAIFETYHNGELPQTDSFIKVESENILLSAVKEAEDRSGDIILRFIEMAGTDSETTVEIHALGRNFKLKFSPYEIKTVRVPKDGSLEIGENNLLEY